MTRTQIILLAVVLIVAGAVAALGLPAVAVIIAVAAVLLAIWLRWPSGPEVDFLAPSPPRTFDGPFNHSFSIWSTSSPTGGTPQGATTNSSGEAQVGFGFETERSGLGIAEVGHTFSSRSQEQSTEVTIWLQWNYNGQLLAGSEADVRIETFLNSGFISQSFPVQPKSPPVPVPTHKGPITFDEHSKHTSDPDERVIPIPIRFDKKPGTTYSVGVRVQVALSVSPGSSGRVQAGVRLAKIELRAA